MIDPDSYDRSKTLPKNLSNSSVSAFRTCAAKFAYRYLHGLPDPGSVDTAIGHFVHAVLEQLYGYPPEKRTIELARELAKHEWANTATSDEAIANGMNATPEAVLENKNRSWKAIEGLFAMEDPTKVDVLSREKSFYVTTNANEGVMGIVDRVDRTADGEVIVDYKGLALDTRVPTPDGWTVMGSLVVGSTVYGRDGNPYEVTAVSSIHENTCYELSMENGTRIIADDEHQWVVWSRKTKTESIQTTAQLSASIQHRFGPIRQWYMPTGADAGLYPGGLVVPSHENFLTAGAPARSGIGKTTAKGICILSVIQVPTVPTVCITVDSPDSTYLITEKFLVSHNTGKKPKQRFESEARFQGNLYGAVVHGTSLHRGEKPLDPKLVRFLYLGERKTLELLVDDHTRETAFAAVSAARDRMKVSLAAGHFAPSPGPLCSYCAYKAVCPAGTAYQSRAV
jgi:RecB family exonuclease